MNTSKGSLSADELTALRAELALVQIQIAVVLVDFILRMTSCAELAKLINAPLSDAQRCAMVFPRLPTVSDQVFMHQCSTSLNPMCGGQSGQILHGPGAMPDGISPSEIGALPELIARAIHKKSGSANAAENQGADFQAGYRVGASSGETWEGAITREWERIGAPNPPTESFLEWRRGFWSARMQRTIPELYSL
jgi:hypothetical protein